MGRGGCIVVSVLGALGIALFAWLAHGGSTALNTPAGGNAAGSGAQGVTVVESSAAPSPAQMLADLDGDKQPVGAYQAALDALGPKCTQDEAHIAGLGDAGYQDLVKNGVTDETRLTVLQHLSDSLPAGMGKTDCASVLSAYLVLREQG